MKSREKTIQKCLESLSKLTDEELFAELPKLEGNAIPAIHSAYIRELARRLRASKLPRVARGASRGLGCEPIDADWGPNYRGV